MESNTYFNSIDLIGLLNKWKKHLLIVGVIALVGSVVLSSALFIKPKYKSEALVYPSNLIAYSNESATEQALQIAQSSDIQNRLITSFDLYRHYNIDTLKNKYFKTDLIHMFEENVSIKKTEYESMQITVYDTDPLIASRIADSIIHFFDIKAREMQAEKSAEVMVIAKNQLERKKTEMDSMENILKTMGAKYGLIDFKSQTKEATKAYLKSVNKGHLSAEVKNLYEGLRTNGQDFNSVSEHLWRIRGTYNDLKLAYETAERDVYKKLTYANVVSRPQPSDKKAYPVRWLIVLGAVGSSLLLAFMVLLVMDSRKKMAA